MTSVQQCASGIADYRGRGTGPDWGATTGAPPMSQQVRPPPAVQRIVREAPAARSRYIGALLRRAARGLRRALAAPRRDPRSSMRGARS